MHACRRDTETRPRQSHLPLTARSAGRRSSSHSLLAYQPCPPLVRNGREPSPTDPSVQFTPPYPRRVAPHFTRQNSRPFHVSEGDKHKELAVASIRSAGLTGWPRARRAMCRSSVSKRKYPTWLDVRHRSVAASTHIASCVAPICAGSRHCGGPFLPGGVQQESRRSMQRPRRVEWNNRHNRRERQRQSRGAVQPRDSRFIRSNPTF